jgi:arginyl-tRNA synthetase
MTTELDVILKNSVEKAITELFPGKNGSDLIQLQRTRKEFEGDITLVVFPLLKLSGKKPEETGAVIGDYLVNHSGLVRNYNIVKGFLNLSINDEHWIRSLDEMVKPEFGKAKNKSGKFYLVEYSSPNTNKPLHLGHLRNNFLGYSVSEILKANGHDVLRTQIINDRGIHICKSMLAWQQSGLNETPQSTGLKGDKLVGKYYVKFDKELREELKPILSKIYEENDLSIFNENEKKTVEQHIEKLNQLLSVLTKEKNNLSSDSELFSGLKSGELTAKDILKSSQDNDETALKGDALKTIRNIASLETKISDIRDEIKELAQNKTSLMTEAKQMLQRWEKGDKEVIALWEKMNGWVYNGFNETYKKIGVSFEKLYYESDTYILGKDVVAQGLEKGVFFRKDDGSVWIDLTADGLDEKVLLRSDGTSVYMTQDLGTAILRYRDYPQVNGMIYTVGNEQDYHFRVLFLILKKLGYAWAEECVHLSYGMVDLPSGKMKSREGTVVDADDLVKDMIEEAHNKTKELGKLEDMSEKEQVNLYHLLGLAALKYFILKVDPKRRMLFNPEESIDLQGNTGPFLQYTYARIQSLLRKAGNFNENIPVDSMLLPYEKEVILMLNEYPSIIHEAGIEYSPARIANYLYDLVKTYNSFYQNVPVLKETDENKRNLRLKLSKSTGNIVKSGLELLGIGVPERM